jgi:hypothetical protein
VLLDLTFIASAVVVFSIRKLSQCPGPTFDFYRKTFLGQQLAGGGSESNSSFVGKSFFWDANGELVVGYSWRRWGRRVGLRLGTESTHG